MSHIGDALQPRYEACRCDSCKYGRTPGTGVVLYMGPDAVTTMIELAHRDGRYEDVETRAEGTAWVNVHQPAVESMRRINRRIGGARERILSALVTDPAARHSPDLADVLHRAEAAFTAQLEEMRRWAPEYEAWQARRADLVNEPTVTMEAVR